MPVTLRKWQSCKELEINSFVGTWIHSQVEQGALAYPNELETMEEWDEHFASFMAWTRAPEEHDG